MKHTFLILVIPDPIRFSLSFFLCSTFSALCFLSFSLSLHIVYFLFLSFLCVLYFLSCCLLSFCSDFLCLLSSFSFCFYLFVFYFSSWLSSTFILCLSSIIFPLLFSLSFCTFVCVCFLVLLLFLPSCSSFLCFLPFNFLSDLLIFLLFSSSFYILFCSFSTLFNCLLLILDVNYCKFSLFIFSINLCYLFPFSLTVFFTKCELFNFFTF